MYFDGVGNFVGMEYVLVVGWFMFVMVLGFMFDGVDGKGKVDLFFVLGFDYWYIMEYYRVWVINNKVV